MPMNNGFALVEFPRVFEIEGGAGRGLEAVDEERLKEVEEMRLQEVEDDARLQAAEEKMSEEAVAVEERPKEVEVGREAINVLLERDSFG
ncbi:hypothetical protein Tco_1305711 [Tanacetum coccineum]